MLGLLFHQGARVYEQHPALSSTSGNNSNDSSPNRSRVRELVPTLALPIGHSTSNNNMSTNSSSTIAPLSITNLKVTPISHYAVSAASRLYHGKGHNYDPLTNDIDNIDIIHNPIQSSYSDSINSSIYKKGQNYDHNDDDEDVLDFSKYLTGHNDQDDDEEEAKGNSSNNKYTPTHTRILSTSLFGSSANTHAKGSSNSSSVYTTLPPPPPTTTSNNNNNNNNAHTIHFDSLVDDDDSYTAGGRY